MGELYQHMKTGGVYRVLYDDVTLEANMEPLVIYQGICSGRKWARPASQFHDGRFVRLEED